MNKQFEEWLSKEYYDGWRPKHLTRKEHTVEWFNQFPFSMQWGVYLEFFDSVGIYIEVSPSIQYDSEIDPNKWVSYLNQDGVPFDNPYHSRTEAQQEAIKKAFEILEQDEK